MHYFASKSKSALSIACATHIIQDGISATIYVLLPILAQAFGFTYAQVGLLKAIKSLSQALLEISSGWISERIGEGRLLIVGVTLSGVGYFLLSNASSALLVAICLLIVGAGTALHHAPSSALIANSYLPATRSSALGLYNASGDVGKLAFTGFFSLAIGAGFAWQKISVLYGIAAILTALGIAFAVYLFFRTRPETMPYEPNVKERPDIKGWGILDWRSYGALLIITGIDTLVQGSILVFVAFLMLNKGLSLSFSTGATVLLLTGGVFGKAGCGYLAERVGVRLAFSVVQTLTAVGLITVIVAPSWFAMTLLIPLGAVVQGTSSITYGFAANLIDDRKMARGYALLYSSGTFAAAVGPLTMGIIADKFGLEIAIYFIAFIAILAIPPIFILRAVSTQPT
jgi:FSR family fosmidomycin resistance protein-like MFS transporter